MGGMTRRYEVAKESSLMLSAASCSSCSSSSSSAATATATAAASPVAADAAACPQPQRTGGKGRTCKQGCTSRSSRGLENEHREKKKNRPALRHVAGRGRSPCCFCT